MSSSTQETKSPFSSRLARFRFNPRTNTSPLPTHSKIPIATTYVPAVRSVPLHSKHVSDRLSFSEISQDNILHLKTLNSVIFPISYNQSFYYDLIHIHPKNLSMLGKLFTFIRISFPHTSSHSFLAETFPVYEKEDCVAAICCRKEPMVTTSPPRYEYKPPKPDLPITTHSSFRIYIMTLGVLAAYRRLKIGSLLISHIIAQLFKDPTATHICLHVHVLNEEAIQFYVKHGFKIMEKETSYYARNRNVDPPDAYRLEFWKS